MKQLKLEFDPKEFVRKQIEQIRTVLGNERALVAVSGGVDSCTCAGLVHLAIGDNMLCVTIDDAFMREGEPDRVSELLDRPPLKLPVRILNVQERFLKEMRELRDAEEKRKVFRETFYRVLSETAQREHIRYLIQGTILTDIVETAGGVKTQHNVLSQIGINPRDRYGFIIVEPLNTLFKDQVLQVAHHISLPKEIIERQPFPGPGLSVRVVGEIRKDKLESAKKTTAIAEEKLAKYAPSQYFVVILDNVVASSVPQQLEVQASVAEFFKIPASHVAVTVFEDKATGVKNGNRIYGQIVGIKAMTREDRIHEAKTQDLTAVQGRILSEQTSFTRVFYLIAEKRHKESYVVAIRAISTEDFLTARVANIPWKTLNEISEKILKVCSNVSAVYYDATPKPPATIEME